MAKLNIPGKRYTKKSMLGISMVVVVAIAIISVAVAAAILPGMVAGHEGSEAVMGGYERPVVETIVLDNNGQISIDADLSQVFVTVKYSNGTVEKVALSELVVEGLDTTQEGRVDNVVLGFGGFKQIVSYDVVPTTLTVEYVASSGGRIDGETVQSVIAGGDAGRVEAIPNEGYRFSGWSDGYSSSSRSDKKISKSTKLIATFTKLQYTVVFYYPDGTTAREEIVPYGQSPTKIPNADKESNMKLYGYKFVGWDTDYTHITRDTNIYPIFEKNAADLNVEFSTDKEGVALGKIKDLMPYYPKGEEAVLYMTANFDRQFIGWQVKNADGKWISLNIEGDAINIEIEPERYMLFRTARISTGTTYSLSFTPPSDDPMYSSINTIDIKANLVFEESEISFTSMSASVFQPMRLTYGAPIKDVLDVEDLSLLSETGYSFKGWYDSARPYNDDGTPALIDNTAIFEQDTTLCAYWEKCIYKAVFLKGDNEDTGFMDQSAGYDPILGGRVLDVYYQDSLSSAVTGAFPAEFPVKTNYTFKGWYLADAYRQPTSYVVDRNYKIDAEVVYIVPVFEVDTRKFVAAAMGSGSVCSLTYNAQYNTYTEVPVTGEVLMPVTEDFVVRIRPGVDYKITLLKLNGSDILDTLSDASGYYDIIIPSIISEDYYMQVTFALADYEVSVTNGTPIANGIISYNVAGASETLKQTSTAVNFSFRADNGVSVNLEIIAPADYYIASVTVAGSQRYVPFGATYHTLVLKDITVDKQVVVVYNETSYTVTLPSSQTLTNGAITPAVAFLQYNGGDSPIFYVTAEEGYYIKSVRANGSIIDPYFPTSSYLVSDIYVNGKEAEEGVYDGRVTQMTLTVNGIYRDINFDVDIAPMYYNIVTRANGVGEVTDTTEVPYNGNASIFATTVTEYYVASVSVNGETMLYGDKSSEAMYSLTSVKRDYEIVFTFERAMHAITFKSGAGAEEDNASIVYDGASYPYGYSGYTFAEIMKGSNVEFTINAPRGYYIYSISVKTNFDGVTVQETLGFNSLYHTLRIDNVNDDYEITVAFDFIYVDYTVYLLCPEGSNPDMSIMTDYIVPVNRVAIARGTRLYGATLDIDVNPDNASLTLDNITVNNADGTAYYYIATTDSFVSNNLRGEYTIIDNMVSINDICSSIDVYIRLAASGFGSTHKVTVASSGDGTLTASQTGDVAIGTEVVFTAVGNGIHSLKLFMINGKEVVVTGNTYRTTVNSDIEAYAIFDETEYNITIANTANGIVNAGATRVKKGASFDIICIPSVGYVLADFSIKIGDIEQHPAFTTDESGILQYTVDGAKVDNNILIEAVFNPISYNVTVIYTDGGSIEGIASGKTVGVYYGTRYNLTLAANTGYFISEITVGGLGIAASSLENSRINPETNTFESGVLNVEIVGEKIIYVKFAPNVYVVTVAETVGGSTLIKRISASGDATAYVDPRSITFGAGDELWVKAESISGYHLSSLLVNGIANDDWRDDTIGINDFNEVYVKAAVISGNVTLRVNYAVNEYSIKVNAINKSLNFAEVDDTTASYGTISISGYTPDVDGIYRGVNHGANVRITVYPRTARGYYISLFEVIFADGTNNATDLTNDINPDGGAYVLQNISADVAALNIEFRRRTYRYSVDLRTEAFGSAYPCNGGVSVKFVNPYLSSAEVLSEGGTYEYGLSYTITVNPGAGYSRTSFEVNGENKANAVRSNNYAGIINTDLRISVEYTIDVFTVIYRGNAGGRYYLRADDGTVIWQTGITVVPVGESPAYGVVEYVYDRQETSNGGIIWIDAETGEITATYNAAFAFVASPNDSNGYYIKSFRVNTTDYAIANVDTINAFNYTVMSDVTADATFELHEYKIRINDIEGGSAAATPDTVKWSGRTQLTLNLNKGYILTAVTINSVDAPDACINLSAGMSYVINGIRENVYVTLTIEKKPYDVTFGGDYNGIYNITNAANGRVFTLVAVAGADITTGQFDTNARSFRTDREGDFNDSGTLVGRDADNNYIGMRYGDKLTLKFMPPEGYYIASISVMMDDDGYNRTTLISSVSELDADDGSGVRTYTVRDSSGNTAIKGNVIVSVTYAIKQYRITYENREGGRYTETTGTTLSYYQALSATMLANEGYYLKSLTINGKTVGTVVEERSTTSSLFKYTTDSLNSDGQIISLEVNASLLNNRNEIIVTPLYERQYFDIIFYINGNMVLSGGMSQDGVLGLYVEGGRIVYNKDNPTSIIHTLQEGYSIESVYFSYAGVNQRIKSGIPYKDAPEMVVNSYTAKSTELKVLLVEALLSYLDFEDPAKNTLRIYYITSRDKHQGTAVGYLVSADSGTNIGQGVDDIYREKDTNRIAFEVKSDYSDGKDKDAYHDYGTRATFTATISPECADKYRFEGFQELIDGKWKYVRDGERGISVLSEGLVISYPIQYQRTFRAVFFRIYKVVVEIHPQYKYYRGSFVSGDPSQMMYRQYATMSAEAIYTENENNGVPLPDIEGTRETLVSVGDNNSAIYTYYIRSGGSIYTRGDDRFLSDNQSAGFVYYKVGYDKQGKKEYWPDDQFTSSMQGFNIRQDVNVYAYAQNRMYISFLMETIGSSVANAGGTMAYKINGTPVAGLDNNSLTMTAGQTLTVEITPADGYRFESVARLMTQPLPDANGYLQFTNRYENFVSTADGSVNLTNSGSKIVLTLTRWDENTIIKVTFRKQITLTKDVQIVPDDISQPAYSLGYTKDSTKDGVYDYNTTVKFKISENVDIAALTGYNKYYQFVGFFINGVNNYTQLAQFFPAAPEITLILNDMDGLSNGVNIVEKNNAFEVNIVARFVLIYNIVVENEYVEKTGEGKDITKTYHNPGNIVASGIIYDRNNPQYYVTSYNIRAVRNESDKTAKIFSMLGEINSIASGSASATSPYNVWNQNKLTLRWDSTSVEDSDSYRFAFWQYRVYNNDTNSYEYVTIPYENSGDKDAGSAGKSVYTFPLNAIYDKCYASHVSTNGEVNTIYKYTYTDETGNDVSIPAIVIRPMFQKIVTITLKKATAVDRADEFIVDEGAVEPRLASNNRSSGSFNYGTVQKLMPSVIAGYSFVGWYIKHTYTDPETELSEVRISDITSLAYNDVEDKALSANATFHCVNVRNTRNVESHLYYNYNADSGVMMISTDDSYTIYARYIRIYDIILETVNDSGTAPALTASLPYLKYYMKNSYGQWVLINDVGHNDYEKKVAALTGIPVGTLIKVTLDPKYGGVDSVDNFNPRFDKYKDVAVYNEYNQNVFNEGNNSDYNLSSIPDFDTANSDSDYVSMLEKMYIVIRANADKRLSISFESRGELTFTDIYVGSAIKLPQALAKIYNYKYDRDEYAAFFIYDGGPDDGDGKGNGQILIKDIPIQPGESYDGKLLDANGNKTGDYANKILGKDNNQEESGMLDTDWAEYGINFNGRSDALTKIQSIQYYNNDSRPYPFAGGNGTSSSDAFRIATIEHLRNLDALFRGSGGNLSGVYFEIVDDIVLNTSGDALSEPLCAAFTANGVKHSAGFNGILNGNGHTLKNLYLYVPSKNNVGLFASTAHGAEIYNLKLVNCYIYGYENVGALIGEAIDTKVENVSVSVSDDGIYDSINGDKNVGGLIGYAHAYGNNGGSPYTLKNISVTRHTVSAAKAATYQESTGFVGGAGGLVGMVGEYVTIISTSAVNLDSPTLSEDISFVDRVSVVAPAGAGGIIGTLVNTFNSIGSITNVIAKDVSLQSINNKRAIGGLVGSIGMGWTLSNAVLALSADTAIASDSAIAGDYANFSAPNKENILVFGGGGIAGHNMGSISYCQVVAIGGANPVITMNGSMIGGIVGVNRGSIGNVKMTVRIYSSRTMASSSFAGGSYGGIVGVNWTGTVREAHISKSAEDSYSSSDAVIEVVTDGKNYYTPTNGGNAPMHEANIADDPTSVYIGGLIGYNNASVNQSAGYGVYDSSFSGKIIFNRRSCDGVTGYTYMAAAIAGNSKDGTISGINVKNAFIKLFHYLYVDQAGEDKSSVQEARLAGIVANNSGSSSGSSSSVTASAEYCGGGTKYTSVTVPISIRQSYYASNYREGNAKVVFTNVNSYSAYSYVPIPIGGSTIPDLLNYTGKAFANDKDVEDESNSLLSHAWNYRGALRYVKISIE